MAYSHDNPAASNLARLEEAEKLAQAALEAVKERRTPQNWGSAGMTVKKFQNIAATCPNPFRRMGEFFHAVKHVGQNNAHYSSHPTLRKYVEESTNWHNDMVRKGYITHTKAAPSGLNETLGQDGGFLVPPQFVQQLLQRTYENDLLSRTTLFPMTSNTLKIPAVNETSRANGSRFGGVEAFWEGEGQTSNETKPSYAQIQLNLNKLFLLVRATDELLEDSGVALETYIESIASQELQFKTGDGLINGTGVGMPLGMLNAPCKVVQEKEPGQAAKTVLTENIVKMWSRLFIGCRENAIWLINQEVEPQLQTMALGVGTGGVVTYMPPGGLSAAPYATLMGKPVIVTEFNSALGDEGDIILCDPSTMLAGTRGGMQSAVSMHVYFSSAEQLFRFILRMDAKPWWLAPLTKYKGNQTVSPIVTLQTRS